MLLYLVQHAEAKREEEDPARGLTDKGRRDIGKVSDFVKKAGVKISRVFHSGKTRALQTAQILAGDLKPENGVSETDTLAPMDDPQIWFSRLSQMDENTALVGHLPHLGKLASLLLCSGEDKSPVDFKMGGIVCFKRVDDDHWVLQWMVVPEIISE